MNKYGLAILMSVGMIAGQALAKDPRFHLKNNTDDPITITLFGTDNFPIDNIGRSLSANTGLAVDINDAQLTKINIRQGKNTVYEFTLEPFSGTYYLKFDKLGNRGILRPQKGVFGYTSDTDVKYSLKKNITQDQISSVLRY